MKSVHPVHIAASTACIALAAGLVAARPAMAQEPSPPAPQKSATAASGSLSEIIVTATRRATNVQDVPIAITAISGESLRQGGISNPRDLTGLAPNLTVDQGIANGQTHASIRGVASTDFGVGSLSPIAIYIDDIYQAYQFGIGTQVFDLNRVEVLRGPQGTLFGRNTTGGALSYYSQAPTDRTEGYFQGSVAGGDFNQYTVEGAYNMPVSETLAMRASFRADRRDNYIDNLYDGAGLGHYTNIAGRVQLAWKPTDTTDINLKLFGLRSRGDGPIYIGRYLGGECASDPANNVFLDIYNKCVNGVAAPDSPDSHHTFSEVPTFENYHNYGATLKIDQRMGAFTLTSITGWQKGSYGIATNDDGSAGDFFHSHQGSKTEQISQEIRLATPAASRLRAVLGAFAQHDKILADQGSGSTTLDPTLGFEYYAGSLVNQKTTSLAGFGSITFDVTKRFSVVGGLRYSHERKKTHYQDAALFGFNVVDFSTRDFMERDLNFLTAISDFPPDPNFNDVYENAFASKSWNRMTWDVTANFKPTEDALLYAKVATGFRSGGFPTFITQPGTFVRLDPEKVTSYEIGFKSEWFDHRLRINGDVYYMKYKDMQVQTPNTSGPGLVLSNAASSSLKGVELEIEAVPVPPLHLNASLGYSDAKYKDYKYFQTDFSSGTPTQILVDLSGNRLPYAPKWTASFGGSYDIPVGSDHVVQLGTNWSYRGKIYFDPYQSNLAHDRSALLGNASLTLKPQSGNWQITAFVNNLTDRLVKAFQYQIGYVSPTIYAPRRTFGLRASVDF